jgi:hypothetical protein
MVANSFGNRNFMQPMVKLSMHSKCLDFFSFKFWVVVGEDFFHFSFVSNTFPSSSQRVPIRFPICSQGYQCVPTIDSLESIRFDQSPPLLTYIGGPKGEAIHLSLESSILGEPPWFQLFFLQWANKIGSFQKKKKRIWTCQAPPTN